MSADYKPPILEPAVATAIDGIMERTMIAAALGCTRHQEQMLREVLSCCYLSGLAAGLRRGGDIAIEALGGGHDPETRATG